jgi:hypothetical protein
MSRFEFNTVLVSIVLAFAISELLTASSTIGRNLRAGFLVGSCRNGWTLVRVLGVP